MVIKKIFFAFSIAAFFILASYTPISAQLTDDEIAAGLESCFQYYDYGKVGINLATEKSSYKNGERAKIIGTVTNQNSFPIVDVVVYTQLRRINSGDVVNEGHHLLERKQTTEPMNLLPNETRFITATLPILDTYPNGSYQLQYYVASRKGFHYAGRPFLEEDYGGNSFFDITESTAPLVYFDLSGVRVNQQPVVIRGATQEFADDVINLSIRVVDNRIAKTHIPVTVKFYSFEDTFEKYLLSTEQKIVSAQTGSVEMEFRPPTAGPYVMVVRMESPAISEIKYRFAKVNGTPPVLRVNDIGITNFPPNAKDRAYICFHSQAPAVTSLTSLTLKLLDKNKKAMGEKNISRQFSGSVLAVSLPFNLPDARDFWVQGTVKKQKETQPRVFEIHYTCDAFGSSPKDLTLSFESKSSTLSIGAVNSCGDKIREGGHIESIRIKNAKGGISKELYNTDSISQNIAVGDLPAGNYIAEVRSGNLTKDFSFVVAGITARPTLLKQLVIPFIILASVLLLFAGVYYYRRKRKQKQPGGKQV